MLRFAKIYAMKNIVYISLGILLFGFYSCKPEKKESPAQAKLEKHEIEIIELTLEQANILATLPIDCVTKEYPNKLGHVLGGDEDLGTPKTLHPAFYGCFDWHSAVHGHWSMVRLLKTFPDLKGAAQIRTILLENMSKENIAKEVAYFNNKHNKNYERTYGWVGF